MSTLGDDIRAQKTVAAGVATKLSTSATDLQTKIRTMEWQSGAADACRGVLNTLHHDIETLGAEVTTLSTDLDKHATAVEHHEATLHAAMGLPGKAAHLAVSSLENGWNAITHPSFTAG